VGSSLGIGTTTPRAGLDVQAGVALISGTLGIGTTVPSGVGNMKLDVHGTAYINGNLGIGTEIPRAQLDVLDSVLVAGNLGIGTTTPRAAVDIVGGGGSLLVAGNLGVGTTAPRGVLDVVGGACFINQGNLGIGTATPAALPLEIWSTKAMLIPVGLGAERPATAYKGYLRYNTSTDQFEGYGAGNQWGSLGGVRDVAGETYISAELTAGSADNNLRFITSNVERMRIDRYGNVGIGTDIPLAFLNIYDRDAAKATVLVNWDSPSGKRYASIDAPTNSFIDPVVLDTNNRWAIQTNGGTRMTVTDDGVVVASGAQLLLPDGSAGAPAASFTNATTTGVFLAGTNTLGLTVAGGEAARVVSSGNVGIGTTQAATRLHVFGDITATNFLGTASQVAQTLTRGSYLTGANYNGSTATTWAVDATTTATGGKVVARDASGGIYAANVGIGTTVANYPLHVIGSIYTTQSVISYSDRRAKFDLEVIPDPLEKINELHGYTYSFIQPKLEPALPDTDDVATIRRDTGLIAQEVERVIPEAVHEDPNGMKAISYGNLAGLFVEALRAIMGRLDALEKRINENS
jgi:hypothetical protein